MGGGSRTLHRARLRSGNDLVRRHRERARRAVASPVTDRLRVCLAVLSTSEKLHQVGPLGCIGRLILCFLSGTVGQPAAHLLWILLWPGPAWLSWAHDGAGFVDPHDVGNVDDTEQCIHLMCRVD